MNSPLKQSRPFFRRVDAPNDLSDVIECFWIVEDAQDTPQRRKIIPDGFPEIIFHYGDPYRTNITGTWELQSDNLLAGQGTRHFYLENTGVSAMVGIKLRPTGVTRLFDLDMSTVTDQVVEAREVLGDRVTRFQEVVRECSTHDSLVANLADELRTLKRSPTRGTTGIENAVALIFRERGMVPVGSVATTIGVGERQAERLFRKWIGLGPKAYCRIVRFNQVFRLVTTRSVPWAEITYLTGYYDQSHFIRDFRAFTGEDPSQYYFEEKNMANFFLRKVDGFE